MLLDYIKDERCRAFFGYFGLAVFTYAAVKTSIKILNNIGTFFLGFGTVNLKKYGSWAVVTGCTDGIGKAYAENLAKKGLNLVLISRTLEKLQEQAKYLTEKYKVETKVIAVDFTEPNTIYPEIRKQLEGLDIGILFNNVGMTYKYPEYLHIMGEDAKILNDMINCNIMSLTKMTAIVLPQMVQKRKGIIVNNSSASGRMPCPLVTVYSSTKAYVDFFSRALAIEYKSKGILVQSLCPFYVSTKMTSYRDVGLLTPSADKFAQEALKTIGTQSVTNGCLSHNIQGWACEEFLPEWLRDNLGLKELHNMRQRALEYNKNN